MKKIIEKISQIENLKGVWFYSDNKLIERLNIPLDQKTQKDLNVLLYKLVKILDKKAVYTQEVGASFVFDYLLFKKMNDSWLILWSKKDASLALLRMEVEVILNERRAKKKGLFKKIKFW